MADDFFIVFTVFKDREFILSSTRRLNALK